MKKVCVASLAVVAGLLTFSAAIESAWAALDIQTWVSSTGNDSNICSRASPCQTFGGALAKTAVNGQINCVDPGGYGTFSITKSITIDCSSVYGSVVSGTNGIIIMFDNFASTDTRRAVNIRGLSLNGAGTGTTGISISGEGSNSFVFVQEVVIDGFGNGFSGISDYRTNGNLTVQDTTIKNSIVNGVSIKPSGGTGIIRATLERVTVSNCQSGLSSSAGAAIAISNSVFTMNSLVGVQIGPSSQALVESTKISHNGTGISSAGLIRLMGSSVFLNANAAVSGTVYTYSNNAFVGSIGGTIVPIAPSTNPSGLQ